MGASVLLFICFLVDAVLFCCAFLLPFLLRFDILLRLLLLPFFLLPFLLRFDILLLLFLLPFFLLPFGREAGVDERRPQAAFAAAVALLWG